MTFAETQLKIARRKAKYEKLMNSSNMADRTAAMMMHARAVNAENLLFDAQEGQKTPEPGAEGLPQHGGGIDFKKYGVNGFSGDLLKDSNMNNANEIGFSGNLLKDSQHNTPLSLGPTDLSGFTPSSTESPGVAGFADWAKGNKMAAAGNTVLNGIDYFSKMSAIRKMQAPPKPIDAPQIALNKTLDTGAERNDISRNRISNERIADRIPGMQTSTALKQKAGVDYLNNMSRVHSKEQNYATQMGNQENYMNHSTRARNIMQFNQYADELTGFNNNRIGARQNAMSDLLGDTSMVMRDQVDSREDMMKWALEAAKYDPTVLKDIEKLLSIKR